MTALEMCLSGGCGRLVGRGAGELLADDLAAQIDALVADRDPGRGPADDRAHLVSGLVAERAAQRCQRRGALEATVGSFGFSHIFDAIAWTACS